MVSANSPGSSARHPLRIEVAGQTDVGRKRAHNEDNFAIMPEFGLYVVADGMGGHASGEIASKMAIETLQEFFESTAEDPERTWPYRMDRGRGYEENRLITGIKLCNLRIFEQAQRNSRQRGMGTTLVALFAVEDGVYVAHVGDSRVYRIRDGSMEQLTEDHSNSRSRWKAPETGHRESGGTRPRPPATLARWSGKRVRKVRAR